MKRILLTGGGSGGHIYPLIAVAEKLKEIAGNQIEINYLGPIGQFDEDFSQLGIKIYKLASSKIRRYAIFLSFLDAPKFFWSFFQALFRLYVLMPDVIFSKGGVGAFPVVLAAKFYFIPVIIHESDAVPGLTNRFCAPFSKRIAIAFRTAASYFPAAKTALVGIPIRSSLLGLRKSSPEAKKNLGFLTTTPLLLILGGSQGSMRINNFIFENLPQILESFQIIHQVGVANLAEAKTAAAGARNGYKLIGYLNPETMKEALTAADIVVSRAGASAIYEIAAFEKPAVLIPLDESANNHQRLNAYEYGKSGAAITIEEANLKINVMLVELKKLFSELGSREAMSVAARNFFRPNAADEIAKEILKLVRV
ncbi:MAG: UDP-N-acetylglucosamine--N-acetylmuramyl-(pentapeptide) pyrophosphoryl-undecaprenol N-acetylglucosamine transferase [Patescibacteria group bacterium]